MRKGKFTVYKSNCYMKKNLANKSFRRMQEEDYSWKNMKRERKIIASSKQRRQFSS